MGHPDGGWYDEKPPYVVSAMPKENATNVSSKKIVINFNEFIKLESASEKVMISPPQHEQPEIKATGKNIYVELQDSLLPNTTYTVDFSDAIIDNNESNPMGNYTYTFSTGDAIDTLQVSGYVLEASNLEPVKGILVGLYTEGDSAMCRVARTDSRGHFVIRGIAPGSYTVGAVMDADGDYRFTQRSEKMAFSHDIIVPTIKPDTRQDTLWLDKDHIKDINVTGYTHFLPDDIVLRAFDHQATDRYFLKSERKDERFFTLYFTAPVKKDGDLMPTLRGLNFNEKNAFVLEPSAKCDTITYWLRDTALVNQDTLRLEMTTYITDTIGVQRLTTDTLEILAKTPYAKRMKNLQKEREEWEKALAKRLRRAKPDEVIDTVMPRKMLDVRYASTQQMKPNGAVSITFPTPIERFDSTAVHLYEEMDTLHRESVPFVMTPIVNRRCELFTDWKIGASYTLEVDSLAFTDIYGTVSKQYKQTIQVGKLEDYGSLFVSVGTSVSAPVIVQLLNGQDDVVMEAQAEGGTADFYYITPGTYYLRAFIDSNGNGVWDTGDYFSDRQPEEVYYYPDPVECKAKWDITKTWNITAKPLYRQKPYVITKQKPEAEKTIKQRNAERARSLGIELPAYLK
ncbi:MAG: Ig-like domain-containing protein [Prevotella sp.]|nr:Ig-like domain-containing protein [Prevotella sp.]MBQ9237668.1 Ig-like domain-containing protein [Prevotella sp.]